MWTRRQLLRAPLAAGALAAQPAPPKNILVMVADDLGRHLGCYGDPHARTPNLDKLARQGTLFQNAFATTASCSPSRSVMFTGLYNHTNGQYGLAQGDHNFHLKANATPVSRLLKNAGYRTAVIGKFHVNPPSAFAWDVRQEGHTFDVDALATAAHDFFWGAHGPWYLHLGFGDPHRGPGARFHTGQGVKFDPAALTVPAYLPDTPGTRQDLAEYYTAVERFDRGVGLVMAALEKTGHLDNTLVVVLSDNGVPMPNAKTTIYDAGVHLPMIVRGATANGKNGVVSQAMVSYIDLVPTFLDWTGARASTAVPLPGRSLLPLLGQPDAPGWDQVFLSHTFHGVAMYYPMRGTRTRQYKYIRNLAPELTFPHATDLHGSPTWQSYAKLPPGTPYGRRSLEAYLHRPAEELYDVVQDPQEITNLATRPEHRATLEKLRADVARFRQQTGDPWLAQERVRA